MYISYESREGIHRILISLGLVIFLIGLFTPDIDFGIGLVIGITFWMSASIFRTWLKVDRTSNKNYFQNSKALSKLLASLGVWLILFSIFTNNITFMYALIIAIALFIIAGGFGERNSREWKRNNRSSYINASQIGATLPSEKLKDSDGPYKNLCNNCGSNVLKGDVFCQNCGEKISF